MSYYFWIDLTTFLKCLVGVTLISFGVILIYHTWITPSP